VKNIVGSVLVLIVGVAVLAYGLFVSSRDVVCGGQVMTPGQSCVINGANVDYDALRAKRQDTGLLAMAGGGLFLALGGVALVVQLRRRNRGAAAPPVAV
jgi:hypothetical protein